MGKYDDMTYDEERDILQGIISDMGEESVLSIGDVYSILKEHFNNEILEEYERRHPEKFETYTNYYSCCEDWEDDDCDSFHNDHCPVCDTEIQPYKSEGNLTGKEFEHFEKDS